MTDWEPPDWVLQRVRMAHPKITQQCVDDCLLEFRTYAETEERWRDHQLPAKFQSCLIRAWVNRGATANEPRRQPKRTETASERLARETAALLRD